MLPLDWRLRSACYALLSNSGANIAVAWPHLGLCNTKAPADSPEARAARLQAATDVLERGTEPFIETMLARVLAKTTHENRPDLVDGARRMMRKMSPEDIAQVQRGMAERPDSVETLKTIKCTQFTIVTGDEDSLTGIERRPNSCDGNIPGKPVACHPEAGHYSPWEQPEEATGLLRQFLDEL